MSADIVVEVQHRGDPAVLLVSRDALALLAGCVNEALEAVAVWEFSIRLGFTLEDARSLAQALDRALSTPRDLHDD